MMSPYILVADLSNQSSRSPVIHFKNINLCTVEYTDRSPNVLGFLAASHDPLLSDPIDTLSTCADKYRNAFRKAEKSAKRVAQLLNGKSQTSFRSGDVARDPCTEMPFVRVCDTALVVAPPCEGHARHLGDVFSFQRMEFQFSNVSPRREDDFASTQLLHFSCPSLKVEESLFTERRIPAYDHVDIVSGVCLFSAKLLASSVLEDGRIDAQKLLYGKPTLYEIEYIARSSSAIADVASTIISRGKTFGERRQPEFSMPVRICLDIPNFQYYESIYEKLEGGLCSLNEALQWIEAVDLRHDQVAAVYKTSVHHELQQRGVVLRSDCEVQITPTTNLVGSSIRQALQVGKKPSLDSILRTLSSQGDRTWRDFYDLIPMKDRPQDLRALGHLFYVFHVVRPALSNTEIQSRRGSSEESTSGSDFGATSSPSSCSEKIRRPRCLLISVDDGEERRIYSRAQKLLKKIRQEPASLTYPTLVEAYMSRRIYINSKEAGFDLHRSDPSPELPTMLRSHPYESDAEGGLHSLPRLEPIDIVRHLYGSDCASNLQRWFSQVELHP